MSRNSRIDWVDHTFNPWWGCSKVSPGCKNCYAERLATRFHPTLWSSDNRHLFGDKHWKEPISWDKRARGPERVLCGSMCDVFEDLDELEPQRERLWDLIASTTNLRWLLLTKRPENFVRMLPKEYPWNIWLGVSIEDQPTADERIELLMAQKAHIKFASCEPLIGPVRLPQVPDWVIVGCESGPKRRHMHDAWARGLRDQCLDAGKCFFFKQRAMGGKVTHMPVLDGVVWNSIPEDDNA